MADQGPARVNVLVGDDTISRERRRDEIVAAIRQGRDDVTVESYDPDRVEVSEFVERMLTPSLFGGVRIFTIRHAEQLVQDDTDALATILGADLPDEYLIIEAGECSDKANKALSSFVKDAGKRAKKDPRAVAVVTLARPPDYKIAEWLVANTPSLMNRRISRADAEYLVDLVGYDFDALRSELEKIDLYIEPGRPLTKEAIGEVVEGTRTVGAFELAQALGQKDLGRAVSMVERLFGANFYAPLCISSIYRHFWSLYRILAINESRPDLIARFRRAQRGGDRNAQNQLGVEIGVAAGMLTESQAGRVYPVIIKSGVVDQALSFSEPHLRAVFRWLLDIDVGVKTGQVEATLSLMQMLCVRIVRGPQDPEDVRAYAWEV